MKPRTRGRLSRPRTGPSTTALPADLRKRRTRSTPEPVRARYIHSGHAHHFVELQLGGASDQPRPRGRCPPQPPRPPTQLWRGQMSFDTRNGSRGARQPGGRVGRWMNTIAARRFRKRGGQFLGFNVLVMTTVGRKSGVERSNPVGWFPGKDGSWLIVASAAGAAKNPAWY